jgi:hypothetical protein
MLRIICKQVFHIYLVRYQPSTRGVLVGGATDVDIVAISVEHAEMSISLPNFIFVAADCILAVFIIPTSVQLPLNLRTSPRYFPSFPPILDTITKDYCTCYNLS